MVNGKWVKLLVNGYGCHSIFFWDEHIKLPAIWNIFGDE
jgi:hypothetical protein